MNSFIFDKVQDELKVWAENEKNANKNENNSDDSIASESSEKSGEYYDYEPMTGMPILEHPHPTAVASYCMF